MLEGIRIIEIEGLGPGPFTGMLLADLGADVIVVHRAGGKKTPGIAGATLLDRGKRSIALDLKSETDLDVVKQLIASADGLIEGFRPGVMERLGLGPDVAHALNPALVYGRMTGWGQTGPLAHAAGHDMNYSGLSGAVWHASHPGDAPLNVPTLVGDIGGGAMYLAVGILSGILKARATGQGTVVDAAIYDGSAHMMNLLMALGQSGGFVEARGQSLLDGPHWSRTYRTSDDQFMSVQCLEPQFYAEFMSKLDLQDDADFTRQYDKTFWPELTERLKAIFAAKDQAHWRDLFEGSDACVAPVLSPQQAHDHPMNAARQTWRDIDGALQAMPAPRFDGALRQPGGIPQRGEHNAEIRAMLASGAT